MRKIDDYMKLPYKLEIIPDPSEGGYVASYPELPGCMSIGDTIEEAISNSVDAKRQWLLAALESNITINDPEQLQEYSGQFKLRIPKSLHRKLANDAKKEGISMNQYCVYLLSRDI